MNRSWANDDKLERKWVLPPAICREASPLTSLAKDRVMTNTQKSCAQWQESDFISLTIWSAEPVFQAEEYPLVRYIKPQLSTLPAMHVCGHCCDVHFFFCCEVHQTSPPFLLYTDMYKFHFYLVASLGDVSCISSNKLLSLFSQ